MDSIQFSNNLLSVSSGSYRPNRRMGENRRRKQCTNEATLFLGHHPIAFSLAASTLIHTCVQVAPGGIDPSGPAHDVLTVGWTRPRCSQTSTLFSPSPSSCLSAWGSPVGTMQASVLIFRFLPLVSLFTCHHLFLAASSAPAVPLTTRYVFVNIKV